MNLNRSEDQAGLFGTLLFHALLVFLLFMLMTCESEPIEDPLDGAVAVSLGEPDYGGPDQSTAEAAEATPQPTESQVDEQVTSDVEDAPEVQETTQKPTTTTTKPAETTPERKPNANDLFKPSKPGTGTGSGSGDKPGDQGQPEGQDNGSPDGAGQGGTGDLGGGLSGGISGFNLNSRAMPTNSRQTFGKVTIKICVDKNGKVLANTVKVGGLPQTTASTYLQNLSINAAKKFKFSPKSGKFDGGCGFITFNYKRG